MGKFKSLVLVVLMLALPAVVSAGTAPAVVSVDSYTVQVGQEFTVPVRIANVSNLYGYDVRLPHNTALLQGVRVDHGAFLNEPWFVVRNGFWQWNGAGCNGYCAWYALTSLNPALPVSGRGTLVYVTYRALAPGSVTLTPWIELSTRDGELIPANVRAGTVTVVSKAQDQ
jgi:hypothetical protein